MTGLVPEHQRFPQMVWINAWLTGTRGRKPAEALDWPGPDVQ